MSGAKKKVNQHRMYAEISKVDDNGDGTINVHGIASTESKDAQGETVTKGCMAAALPDYLAHGTGALRAMHQPIAAGYVYKAEVDDTNGQTMISARVVDPTEVLKVQTGTYKGFSIGGNKIKGGYDEATKTISKMRLTEISLVDRPANPEALITMWKGDDIGFGEDEVEEEVEAAPAVAKLDEPAAKPADVPVAPAVIAKVDTPAFTEEQIAKGMYSVRSLAEVLSNIQYLASDALYEAKSENDSSAVPAALIAWLKTGATILVAMTQEETAEMLEGINAISPVPLEVVQMAAKADEIRKALTDTTTITAYIEAAKPYMDEEAVGKALFADGAALAINKASLTETIAKAGARNSKADKEKLQQMHDHSVSLGADCGGKAEKHDHADDIKKVASLEEAITKLEGDVAKVSQERDEAVAKVTKLEAMPAPAKGALRAIGKSDDLIGGESEVADDGPVLKGDGSIDGEATAMKEIKKVHGTGGIRFLR